MTPADDLTYWRDRAAASERLFDLAMTRVADLQADLEASRETVNRLWIYVERLEGQVVRLVP